MDKLILAMSMLKEGLEEMGIKPNVELWVERDTFFRLGHEVWLANKDWQQAANAFDGVARPIIWISGIPIYHTKGKL